MPKFYDSYKAIFDAIKTALVYVPAVPAHDERDFQFAKKYGIEI